MAEPTDSLDFLAGGGEMGERIRGHDWASSPLGAPETWPQSLRSALSICLHSSFPTAIYWGPELRLLYNDAWAPIPAERHPWALGRPGAEVWSDIWDVVGPQFGGVVASGEGFSAYDQMLLMVRGGEALETYWNYSFTPIRGESGLVAGIFNQGNEITDRVMRDRSREAESARQRRMFQQAPGFITILHGPDHVFEFVNDSYVRMFGARDYVGRTVGQAFPELETQGYYELLDRVYRTGERFVATRMPVQLTFPDGHDEQRFLDFIYEPMTDDDGKVSGIFCEGFDVTEAGRTEAQLVTQTHALETLNRIAAATIIEQDLEQIVQLVTDAGVALSEAAFGAFFYNVVDKAGESYMLYSLSGIPRDSFARFPMPRNTDVFAPTFGGEGVVRSDDITADPRYGRNAPHRGMPEGHLPVRSYLAVPVVSRDGNVIGGLFFGHPEAGRFSAQHESLMSGLAAQAAIAIENARLIQRVNDANETLEQRVAERTTELTQAHEALRQAQKMEAVGQLTGGIAHDFNNLLGAIMGGLDLIRRKPDDTKRVLRYAEAGLQAAERGAKLTAQLLAFSRAQRLELRVVRMSVLLDGLRELLTRTLGPAVRLNIVQDGDHAVRSDPTQLEMAVLNLAINARDAMPEGGALTISATSRRVTGDAELADGDYLDLAVSDTGTGMEADVVARALDPFFTTKGVGKGTGLGLSQVYGIARQAGGTVRIDSVPGHGTIIHVLLPVTDSSDRLGQSEVADTGKAAPTSATVLVVDDDADMRGMLIDSLEALGYRVVEAADGLAGLDQLALHDPDLLMLDFAMPGMSGADVAQVALADRPDLPIIFCSGYSDTAAIERAVGSDVPLLRKPFRIAELEAIVASALTGC